MGAINSQKVPKAQVKQMAEGGLYANINAKRKRGDKMRTVGAKGAPTEQAFIDSAKTAKK